MVCCSSTKGSDARLQVLSTPEPLKLVIPPGNLISRLGGSSQFDPCETDFGFPINGQKDQQCAETSAKSLNSGPRYGSAESSMSDVCLDVGRAPV